MQHTSHLLMIEPVNFGFNSETAVNNTFQVNINTNVQPQALKEFNDLVHLLRINKVDVTVIKDTENPYTPDAVFPNNWISFHEDGTVFLYPMFAPNRRKERKQHILTGLYEHFKIEKIIDLSHSEDQGLFLEGTGSMVLDRDNKIAYACISPRTSRVMLDEFCTLNNYSAFSFSATDMNGTAIYHSNVMMCVADKFAVVCLGSVNDKKEKEDLIECLSHTKKEVIDISLHELNCFAGNMLQVSNVNNELLLVMSSQAYHSLSPVQLSTLEKYNRIIHSPLDIIEATGGGSARCMMAEIFNKPL